MNEPLLELEQVRCSVDETTLLDNVSLRTTSQRVGLAGKTAGIAALLEGRAELLSGEVRVLGEPLDRARKQRLFGCATRVNGVPSKWTVQQVLRLAAEMAGYTRSDAKRRAKAVLERVEQPALLKRPWSRLSPIEQSLATLALGLVTEPAVLFVTLPLGEFRLPEILRFGPAWSKAIEGLATIAELRTRATLPEELTWVSSLDSVSYVFENGFGASQGPLARSKTRYLLRVSGDETHAREAMQTSGLSVLPIPSPANRQLGQVVFLIDANITIEGEPDTGPLLDCAIAAGLEILELTPVASVPIT